VIPGPHRFRKPSSGEWKQRRDHGDRRQIQVKLNGVIILDAKLDIVKEPKVARKTSGPARTSGTIGLLGHAATVEFRTSG